MQKASEYMMIDSANLIRVFDFLPYPFLLSEYRNGSQFNIYVNKPFIEEIGYTCDDIPTIDDWFLQAYPDPIYREQVINDWQEKKNRSLLVGNDYVVTQARIQTKSSGKKWFEVKAYIMGSINFVEFINIDREITREHTLEILNENKNRILSILSHDLRSPLNNLHAVLEMVSNDTLALSERNGILKKLNIQVMQMIEFLDATLQWASVNFTQVRSTSIKIEIKSVTTKLLNLYESAIESKEITVTQKLDHHAIVWLDPEVISIVLRNLISNAIKYTPIRGTITISHLKQPNGHAIVVANSGLGISADKIAQITQKNYYSEPGTNGEKGLGIGLKLSQQFLSNAGAALEIESASDLTIFKIVIPYSKEENETH
jgi:signal transduction histidine kinase